MRISMKRNGSQRLWKGRSKNSQMRVVHLPMTSYPIRQYNPKRRDIRVTPWFKLMNCSFQILMWWLLCFVTIQTILREAITAYIKGVSKVSKNLYSRDIDKAKQRRFIITGLHETIHYAKFNKAQYQWLVNCYDRFICIAEDVIDVGETRQMIKTIVDFCESNNIMVVQCFKRRKLARLFGRGQSMSCICILKDSFTVISELKLLQDAFSSFSKNSSE